MLIPLMMESAFFHSAGCLKRGTDLSMTTITLVAPELNGHIWTTCTTAEVRIWNTNPEVRIWKCRLLAWYYFLWLQIYFSNFNWLLRPDYQTNSQSVSILRKRSAMVSHVFFSFNHLRLSKNISCSYKNGSLMMQPEQTYIFHNLFPV